MSSNDNIFYVGQVVECVATLPGRLTKGRKYIVVKLYRNCHPIVVNDNAMEWVHNKVLFKAIEYVVTKHKHKALPEWF